MDSGLATREAKGRSEGGGSQVVFALGGAPGDEVVVRLTRRQGRLWRGEVVEVLAPGPQRREPPCPYFGPCGGCQWQHLTDAEQLAQKSRALADTLRRIGRLPVGPVDRPGGPSVGSAATAEAGATGAVPANAIEVRDPIGMADPWGYRNTSQFSSAPDGTLGYRAFGSRNVVDVEACPISEPAVNAVLAVMRRDPPKGDFRLEVRAGLDGALLTIWGERPNRALVRQLRQAGVIVGAVVLPTVPARRLRGPVEVDQEDVTGYTPAAGGPETLWGINYVELPLLGRRFRVTGGAFFQVNTRPDARPLPPSLLQTAEALGLPLPGAAASTAPAGSERPEAAGLSQADALALAAFEALALTGGEVVVDAYCGVGAFGLLLAGRSSAGRVRASRVIGIESSPIAAADARYNASFGADTFQVVERTVEVGLAGLAGPVDAILLDPPRAGCGPAVVEQIRRLRPRRIAYVSCDPSTLARDLGLLCADGAYAVRWTRVVDLFPQTYHVESVTAVERID